MTNTPAPWTSNVKDYGSAGHNAYVGVDAEDGTVVAHVLCYRGPNLTDVPFAANARLIAAAPELLEAAKLADRFFKTLKFNRDLDWMLVEAVDAIRAAIAKAENPNE